MKKRWLAVGLTAIMSLGCLVACGDGKDDGTEQGGGGNGDGVVSGEQVTQEVWESAFENVDTTNVVGEASGTQKWGSVSYSYTSRVVYAPNKYYMTYEETMTDGARTESEQGAEWVVKAENGYTYRFDAEGVNSSYDIASGSWVPVSWEEEMEASFEYWTEEWSDVFDGDELINTDMTAFTFDSEKGIYYKEKSAIIDEETTSGRVEVMISNGKLYSLKISASTTGENEGSESATYTFKAGEINLPKQDELNTLIASVKAFYHLEELTMSGRTYRPGDEFFMGYMVETDSYTLRLMADGTANFVVSLAGQEDVQTGTWQETSEAFIVTIGSEVKTFVKDGNKLTHEEGSNKIILTK